MDRKTQLLPLGGRRLRVLECLGGYFRFAASPAGGYFEIPADVDILTAFRAYVARMSKKYAPEPDSFTISLLAAGRLLTGDLTAASIIVDHLPAEAHRLDHGAGICLVTPQDTLVALPLPANLNHPRFYVAGSAEQAALRAWLAGHQDKLRWLEIEGVYLPRATKRPAPPAQPAASAVTRVRHITDDSLFHVHDNSELIFIGDVPTIVVEGDADRQHPTMTIPLDPRFLHTIDWEDAQYVYERPVEPQRRPPPRRSMWQRLFW